VVVCCDVKGKNYEFDYSGCTALISTLLVVFGFVVTGYFLSRLLRRNDVADGLWGLGFIAMALVHYSGPFHLLAIPSKLSILLVFAWGLRLSIYLWVRLLSKTEDIRYLNWRREWGKTEPLRAFLQIFLLQGILMGIVSCPIVWILSATDNPVGPFTVVGTIVFLMGFLFEAIADAQMAVFKKNPQNKQSLLNTGLWAFVRHPNYFGEIAVWWGFYLMALQTPGGWVTVISPLLMTFLLVKVSGVSMLDKVLKKNYSGFESHAVKIPSLLPFTIKAITNFGVVVLTLVLLDFFWLGIVMGPFYSDRLHSLVRLQDGRWAPVLWAVVGVYIFLALGIFYFAIRESKCRWDAVFRGTLLGLVIYGVYDFTNYSLLSAWPLEVVLVDIVWGAFLCGFAAFVGAGMLRK